MSINLLVKVQENLNYPPLQKIDPNTQQVKTDSTTTTLDNFSQAAIPAVLTGLCKYSTTDNGATEILRGDNATNWVTKIFNDNKNEVIDKINSYATLSNDASVAQLNNIANEAIKITKENNRLIVAYANNRANKDEHNRKRGLQRLEKQIKKGKFTKSNSNNFLLMDLKEINEYYPNPVYISS